MRYIVDRIESDKAVLEGKVNKRQRIVSLELLPKDIHDGDILIYKKKEYKLLTKEVYRAKTLLKEI